jgi:hypothetical protein
MLLMSLITVLSAAGITFYLRFLYAMCQECKALLMRGLWRKFGTVRMKRLVETSQLPTNISMHARASRTVADFPPEMASPSGVRVFREPDAPGVPKKIRTA